MEIYVCANVTGLPFASCISRDYFPPILYFIKKKKVVCVCNEVRKLRVHFQAALFDQLKMPRYLSNLPV